MINNVVITGGSSGIGLEISKLLLERGSSVFILSREAENCVLKNIKNCFVKNTDVSDVGSINNSLAYVKSIIKQAKIDVLINCAGIGKDIPLNEIDETTYEKYFSTNVKGTIFTTKLFVPLINQNGIICNFSSIAGIKGFDNWSLYCATKYAIEGFSQSIRKELRSLKIRVMVIRPGAIDTPLYSFLSKDQKEGFIHPKTVADVVVNSLFLPNEAIVEDVFINNAVGDL